MSPFTLKDIFNKYDLAENEIKIFLMTKSFMDDHPDDDDSNFRNVYFGNSRFTTTEWLSIVPKKIYNCKYVLLCFSLDRKEWLIEGLYEVLGQPIENTKPDRSKGEARWTYPMRRIDEHILSSELTLQIKFLYKKSQNYVLKGVTVLSSPVFILPEKIDFTPIFEKEINEKQDSRIDYRKIAERYLFFIKNNDLQAQNESRRWISADSMDKKIIIGKSEKWTNTDSWREHIVPCKLIHEKLIELAKTNQIDAMVDILEKYLKIVLISLEERMHIDFKLKFKTKMPPGWDWGDNALARLDAGKIKIVK